MKLSSLLKKGTLRGLAAASPSPFIDLDPPHPPTVATAASLAVARPADRATNDERAFAPVTADTTPDLQAESLVQVDSKEAARAYYDHHRGCVFCIAAGRAASYGPCCEVGQMLWDDYSAADATTPISPETTKYDEDAELARLRREAAARWGDGDTVQRPLAGRGIDTLQARVVLFCRKGMSGHDGEALASKLSQRDRDNDDRRLCFECDYLAGHRVGSWRCGNWRIARVATQESDALLSSAWVQQLQRCDGYAATPEIRA